MIRPLAFALSVSLAAAGFADEPIAIAISKNLDSLTVAGGPVDAIYSTYMKVGGESIPIVGKWSPRTDGREMTFVPRYRFERGITIVVRGRDTSASIAISPISERTTNSVTAVYPTAERIPANQLRFYIEFAEEMRVGEAWSHIGLFDSEGTELDSVFLELDEELWSSDRKRLTVLLDPGRVKRELKPREENGPALEEDRRYTLKISKAWKSAEGQAMTRDFTKVFRTTAAERSQIDPKRWKFSIPGAGGNDLNIDFGRSLDFGLCQRVFDICDDQGKKVECVQSSGTEERSRRFSLANGWPKGRYNLMVRNVLEDTCGNRIGRSFEVDLIEPIAPEVVGTSTAIPFEVR